MTGKQLFERVFSNWVVKILSVAAAVVLFLFHRIGSLEERFLSVPLEYRVDERLVATEVSAESARVDIRGSGDEIFLVLADDIVAYVDLTSYTSEGIFKSPVLLEKKGTAETVDVEMIVDPLEVTVTLERKVEKELPVVPQMLGYPPAGYELVRYLVVPVTMIVSGPRSSLQDLDRLETEEIDLTGRKADFSVSVQVQRPDKFIVFSGSPAVEVRGFIKEVVVEKTFETVPIEYINLPETLVLVEPPLFGSLHLSGPELLVESLRAVDLKLEVDCGKLTKPGVYELPVSAPLPSGLVLLTEQPTVVNIRVIETTQELSGQTVGASSRSTGTGLPGTAGSRTEQAVEGTVR